MTNSSPAFSVIIPCYNAETYIGALLDSLIATRYPALEILCLDDLSRDHTRDIVARYAERYPAIHLITHTVNQGPGLLRAEGLRRATSDYVLIADADDFYEPDLLAHLADVITTHPDIDVIEFPFYVVRGQDRRVAPWLNRGQSGLRTTANENIMLDTALWNKCYRRDFLLKHRLYETPRTHRTSCGEIPAHICSLLVAGRFYWMNHAGYNYRIVDNSLCHDSRQDARFLSDVWLTLDDLKSELQRLNVYQQDDYIRYCATVLNWHITGKFSKTDAYRTYYNRVRSFMQAHRSILTSDKNFRRIIKRPYWFMMLGQRFKQIRRRFIVQPTLQ